MHRARNQYHSRSPPCGRGRNRIAHFAARPITDVAHGIKRFLRWPSGDQHSLTVKIGFTCSSNCIYIIGNACWVWKAARSSDTAGQPTFVGID
jgi:hypothetical protein